MEDIPNVLDIERPDWFDDLYGTLYPTEKLVSHKLSKEGFVVATIPTVDGLFDITFVNNGSIYFVHVLPDRKLRLFPKDNPYDIIIPIRQAKNCVKIVEQHLLDNGVKLEVRHNTGIKEQIPTYSSNTELDINEIIKKLTVADQKNLLTEQDLLMFSNMLDRIIK